MPAEWRPRRIPSRWPTTSGPCAAWRCRRSRSPLPVCWSIKASDSPPARWCGWIAAASSWPFQFGRASCSDWSSDVCSSDLMALSPISVSATGVLVYQGVGQPPRQMVWMDRGGRQLAVSGTPGNWGPPRISPDGNHAVVAKSGPDGGIAHLWLLDASGGAEQMTDGPMHEGSPIWSPDGSRIAYFGKQGDAYDIFVRAAQVGSKSELMLKGTDKKFPTDWSHDGRRSE